MKIKKFKIQKQIKGMPGQEKDAVEYYKTIQVPLPKFERLFI